VAPHRILKIASPYSKILIGLVVLFLFLISGCSTSRKAAPSSANAPTNKNKKPAKNSEKKAFAEILNANRSLLSDVYAAPRNEIPAFLKTNPNGQYVANPGRGYRIQILSTRSAGKADTVAKHFRSWADSVMVNYIPETYVLFKQPFYKVHVGDFQLHTRAQKLTNLLKKRYPGAWVVHDKIVPELVPPDTVTFKLKNED
jgi:hypothetical protein